MFKIYSKNCEYVLRLLSRFPPESRSDAKILAKDICRESKIPLPSARKALQCLVRAGFLRAVSGPNGGYVLAKDPANISILDVIIAVDGEAVFDQCIMGLPECGNRKPCPVHQTWRTIKGKLRSELSNKTLASLMNNSKCKK